MRRPFTKTEREQIYAKCGGHCAYCGCELPYDKMQIDHVISVEHGGTDDMDNLLPACRSCNHYKHCSTLESFRRMLEKMPAVLARDNVTYQIAVRYGLVDPKPHPVVFYFEQEEIKDEKM